MTVKKVLIIYHIPKFITKIKDNIIQWEAQTNMGLHNNIQHGRIENLFVLLYLKFSHFIEVELE